ncbi:GCN5-related N-acetyltransferase-like protein [Thermothelomyces thermophilus ATCC 42464]|uniref:GCN5-related N-acetyltransferase-like protein n=1 Tax=Thermothelomyces thermophilus (strain ATCC 42464 / BCRC 31852 / DSM 1799) TaxID=573729 RepID=G2Q3H9_THET4|nr:GCN5-related N-acetyltransferase-like protein [Thermothelomyces thermophilus ATCC 42464]AEO55239.1 GCN5-related N-acetyltransferase-like protein [Thermothelomyces thermophilus ATCC 42464]
MASSVSSSTGSDSPGSMTTTTMTTTTAAGTKPQGVTVVATLTKRSLIPARWKEGSVRVVGMAECTEAALTLAHAFATDDYARYLVDDDGGGGGGDAATASPSSPSPSSSSSSSFTASSSEKSGWRRSGGGGGSDLTAEESKWRLHVDFLVYTVAAHCISGLVTAVGPECDSVALWVPPGKHLDGWWTQLRSGMWRLYFQFSHEARKRYFDEILPLLHDTKAQVLGDRNGEEWYLSYLGTKPSSQGRGYAAKLLKDVMARADAENRPIYLESSSLANNAYYEKFDFEVKRDIFLERGPVPVRLSIMVREPRVPGCKVAYASPNPSARKRFPGAVKKPM